MGESDRQRQLSLSSESLQDQQLIVANDMDRNIHSESEYPQYERMMTEDPPNRRTPLKYDLLEVAFLVPFVNRAGKEWMAVGFCKRQSRKEDDRGVKTMMGMDFLELGDEKASLIPSVDLLPFEFSWPTHQDSQDAPRPPTPPLTIDHYPHLVLHNESTWFVYDLYIDQPYLGRWSLFPRDKDSAWDASIAQLSTASQR